MKAERKTNVGMLPQSQTLEVQMADKPGTARNASGQTAAAKQVSTNCKVKGSLVSQHSRGEREGSLSTSPSRPKGQKGVSPITVFVLDKHGKPLMPTHPARARELLKKGRAKVHKVLPFTIRLTERVLENSNVQPVRLKIDPGSVTTGISLVREEQIAIHVVFNMELTHRGKAIRMKLKQRSAYRRRRRTANLRYRKPRFNNRTRAKGWLPPSLQSRVDNVLSWTKRLKSLIPISAITVERVKFDMQAMMKPGIEGVEYQQGELQGYEVREYLLEKWGRKCAYCDADNVPLQIEHVLAKANGGTNRLSNLALACECCNQNKGKLLLEQFLSKDKVRLERIKRQLKTSLKDAAAVNATRNAIYFGLLKSGLQVEAGTGGQTKFNRSRLGIPKAHCLDAACAGKVTSVVDWDRPVLQVKAYGRGSYQRTRTDSYGFMRTRLTRQKTFHGFRTGDMVRAKVTKGKKIGEYVGRVAVRETGSFNIQTAEGTVQGLNAKYFSLLMRADGYMYSWQRMPTIQK